MAEQTLITCRGAEIHPYLKAAAHLRLTVFREFPYLYDGTFDHEQDYLSHYAHSENAFFALLLDGQEVVGISTGLPLVDADESFQLSFLAAGMVLEEIFYLGESCLRREYRGRGWGHAFFDKREEFAQSLGAQKTAFCSVLRADDHPLKPSDYRTNEAFWRKRGYRETPMLAALAWQQIDAPEPVSNQLAFWLRECGSCSI
jgi:GNAT superfamily N-acetyltransferase